MNQIVHSGLGQAAQERVPGTPSAVSLPQGAETAPLMHRVEVATDTKPASAAVNLDQVLAAPVVDHSHTLFGGMKRMLQAAKSVVREKLQSAKDFAHALPSI